MKSKSVALFKLKDIMSIAFICDFVVGMSALCIENLSHVLWIILKAKRFISFLIYTTFNIYSFVLKRISHFSTSHSNTHILSAPVHTSGSNALKSLLVQTKTCRNISFLR
jgi:hypothetical protein